MPQSNYFDANGKFVQETGAPGLTIIYHRATEVPLHLVLKAWTPCIVALIMLIHLDIELSIPLKQTDAFTY